MFEVGNQASLMSGTGIRSSNFEPKKCIKKSGTQEFVRSSGHNSQRTILPDGEQSWRQALERLCILSSYESKRFLEAGDHISVDPSKVCKNYYANTYILVTFTIVIACSCNNHSDNNHNLKKS